MKVSITTAAPGAFRTGIPASLDTARSWACRSRSSSTRTSRRTLLRRRQSRAAGGQARSAARSKGRHVGYTCELMAKAIDQSALDLPLTAEDKERFVTFLVSEGTWTPRTMRTRRTAREGQATRTTSRRSCSRASAIVSDPSSTGREWRRCSSPSAAWIRSRRGFSGSSATRSRLAPRSSRFISRPRREGRLQEPQDRRDDGSLGRLLRVLPAAHDTQPPRRQSFARNDGGRKSTPYSPSAKMGSR